VRKAPRLREASCGRLPKTVEADDYEARLPEGVPPPRNTENALPTPRLGRSICIVVSAR
jgi:hypothetical protein